MSRVSQAGELQVKLRVRGLKFRVNNSAPSPNKCALQIRLQQVKHCDKIHIRHCNALWTTAIDLELDNCKPCVAQFLPY